MKKIFLSYLFPNIIAVSVIVGLVLLSISHPFIAGAIIIHWYGSLFVQTFFHHRYAAHGMFSMSRRMEKVFFIFSFIFQGSSFLTPYAYGTLHRLHHAYSDDVDDPHSPHNDRNIFVMMWRTSKQYGRLLGHRIHESEKKFECKEPRWGVAEKVFDHWIARIFWIILYVLFYYYFATIGWLWLLLPVHFVMGPLQGAVVNWCGHMYGYQNYDNHDHSRNTLLWDVLLLGELYQNNHHMYASRPNFAKKVWEFDPVYPVILFFDLIGVINLKVTTSR